MALVTCRECSGEVSDRARACPQCGSPRGTETGTINHWSREILKLVIAMVVLGLLLVLVT